MYVTSISWSLYFSTSDTFCQNYLLHKENSAESVLPQEIRKCTGTAKFSPCCHTEPFTLLLSVVTAAAQGKHEVFSAVLKEAQQVIGSTLTALTDVRTALQSNSPLCFTIVISTSRVFSQHISLKPGY